MHCKLQCNTECFLWSLGEKLYKSIVFFWVMNFHSFEEADLLINILHKQLKITYFSRVSKQFHKSKIISCGQYFTVTSEAWSSYICDFTNYGPDSFTARAQNTCPWCPANLFYLQKQPIWDRAYFFSGIFLPYLISRKSPYTIWKKVF